MRRLTSFRCSRYEVVFCFVICTTVLVLFHKSFYISTGKCNKQHFQISSVSDQNVKNTALFNLFLRHFSRHTTILTDDGQMQVAFLDVSFTGGRTVRNILNRSFWQTRLVLLAPTHSRRPYFLFYNLRSIASPQNTLKRTSGKMQSNKDLQTVVSNRTIYIGILRSPFEQFISTISFLEPDYIFNISSSKPVETFLERPQKYEPKDVANSWTNNRMAFEFGFHPKFFQEYNKTEVKDYLKILDKIFQLVIIREIFDESIILMKRLLNLRIEDVLYINAFKGPTKVHLPSFAGSYLHWKYARLDNDLYYFFYERLQQQIKDGGEDFQAELKLFRELRNKVKVYCTSEMGSNMLVHRSFWNEPFNVTKDMCECLKEEELDFS